ncbi:MAG: prolipoprotein diacylglyceryl transferase [Bdellovibrionales bacterium GWB1_55_8]|nr:MAG: prolipoprotein diacylglyceryl transferase [Bdellovibrionales bacterium GWB1_55_8]
MHPLLVNLGSLPIHTYGVMIAIGFVLGVLTVKTLAKRAGLDAERFIDLAFWCLVIGFLGARILYIITRWDYFAADPAAALRVWEGGLVFFGGPIAVIPFAIWYLRHYRISEWKAMDVLMPGLVASHAFGRLGCLGAGCCYGKPTDSFLGVRLYSELVESHLRGVPLHPTQLYEAVALLLLFGGLLLLFRRRAFDGQVGLTYFAAYPLIRSVIEIFRGDLIRGFVIPDILSTSQFISIFFFAVATFFLLHRSRRSGRISAKVSANV